MSAIIVHERESDKQSKALLKEKRRVGLRKEKSGGEGYRSPYLSHAKRALYHLSYTPFHFYPSSCPHHIAAGNVHPATHILLHDPDFP